MRRVKVVLTAPEMDKALDLQDGVHVYDVVVHRDPFRVEFLIWGHKFEQADEFAESKAVRLSDVAR